MVHGAVSYALIHDEHKTKFNCLRYLTKSARVLAEKGKIAPKA